MRRLLFTLAIALAPVHTMAATYTVGAIEISAPWMRATPKGAEVAGAYMTITNKGTAPDRLLGGSSPIAARFELHTMTMDGGVMKMRPISGGIEIKPGETVQLKPQAVHVMLVGLKAQVQQGQHVKATLEFEHAGKVEIGYQVESMGAAGVSPETDHMQMDHMQRMDHGPMAH